MRTRYYGLLCISLLGACAERGLGPVDPCTSWTVGLTESLVLVDTVDLLLMIDNSCSMTEEQASVVTEIPRIVEVLTTGDRDGDGVQDFTPVRSLHLGIIDSDMGLGDVAGIATCDPGFGDDGLMQIVARHPATGCRTDYSDTYPGHVFDFTTGGAMTVAQFGMDVGCVITIGTSGCGFEFELEAPLKALSLAPTLAGDSPVSWTRFGYRPPTFFAGTVGHGNDPATNGAFLRPDSVLAVVTVNDEDDCSTPEPQIFSPDNPEFNTVDLNLRCHVWADHLYPVQRYADGLLGLRPDARRLVYAAITGVPPPLAGMEPALILADPAMEEQINPAMTNQILPACSVPGRGVAYPARRMTELARLLDAAGANATMQSICNSDFGPAFDEVLWLVTEALDGECLGSGLVADEEGFLACDLLEVLPPIGSGASYEHCADLPHPEAYALESVESASLAQHVVSREVCRVRQVGRAGAGLEPGWALDDGDPALLAGWSDLPSWCDQRVHLSAIDAVPGAELRFTCTETLCAP